MQFAIDLIQRFRPPGHPGAASSHCRNYRSCPAGTIRCRFIGLTRKFSTANARPANDYYDLESKRERAKTEGLKAWIDPEGYRRFIAGRKRFRGSGRSGNGNQEGASEVKEILVKE